MLGKSEGRMRWLDDITDSMGLESEQTPRGSEGQESGCAAVHGVAKIQA